VIEETLFDAEEKMEKAVSVAKDDLGSIRTGRANPGMFARVVIDYYGSPTPITQVSSITVPEPRMVVIKPYEQAMLGAIETSIRNSDLGVNPTNNGDIIRISVPQLTEERRRELAKQAKVNTFHLQMLAYQLEKMRDTPDGDGSLLDHTLFLYGSGMSDSNLHIPYAVPTLVVGGPAFNVTGGRHIIAPKGTPLTNLQLTLLDKLGLPTEHFGDSTGELNMVSGV